MKASTYTQYGGPENVQLTEIPKPVPGKNQVLLRVKAASVNPYDWHFLRGKPTFMRLFIGLRRPRKQRLGKDVAGIVEAVGPEVTRWNIGDEVFGDSKYGSFSEYCLADEDGLAAKPTNLSWPESASLGMCGSTALQGLDDADFFNRIKKNSGLRVAVNGANGGIGHMLVQICKASGAHVTATCKTSNVAWVKSLGADAVIDYTRDTLTSGKYDLVIDTVRTHAFKDLRASLVDGGVYICLGFGAMGPVLGPLPQAAQLGTMRKKGRQMQTSDCKYSAERFDQLRQLAEAGALRPHIEHTFPLEQTAKGIAHVGAGHTRGKTVIVLGP